LFEHDLSENRVTLFRIMLYPQFHARPIGVQVQHGPKLPPL
jgi:hypothetical protein